MLARTLGRRAMLAMLGVAVVVSACGGGGDGTGDQPGRGNAVVLGKYQGTWSEQCAMPIDFGPGGFGPASQRESLVFSAPDAKGVITAQSYIEFFSSTLACYDRGTLPYAVMIRSVASRILWVESLAANETLRGIPVDVVSSSTPEASIQVTGNGVTSEVLNGTEVWRVTFPDGKSVVADRRIAAEMVEVALSAVNMNGVPNSALFVNGDSGGAYLKIRP
jgi:hypothetical protein